MEIANVLKVMEMVSKCPVCGCEKIGNGSKFIAENDVFERNCRECGWKIKGRIENNSIIIESDNSKELIDKRKL